MKKEIVVNQNDETGATPVAKLVQLANSFDSAVYLAKEGVKVNAKSIMGMMNFILNKGEEITIEARGEDEEQAIIAIERFILDHRE